MLHVSVTIVGVMPYCVSQEEVVRNSIMDKHHRLVFLLRG